MSYTEGQIEREYKRERKKERVREKEREGCPVKHRLRTMEIERERRPRGMCKRRDMKREGVRELDREIGAA